MAKQCYFCGKTIGFLDGYKQLNGTNDCICPKCDDLVSDYINRMWNSSDIEEINTIKDEAVGFLASKKYSIPQADKLIEYVYREYNSIQKKCEEKKKGDSSQQEQLYSNLSPETNESNCRMINKDFIAVTSNRIEGYRIKEYRGIATGTAVMGKGALTGIGDFGNENRKLSSKIDEVKNLAIDYAIENAISMGGNALIATNVSFNTISSPGGVISATSVSIVVMVSGTAVTIEKTSE